MKVNTFLALVPLGSGLIGGCGGGNDNISITPTAHLAITLPAESVRAGEPYLFTVSALDASNAVVTTYTGTVHITTSDPSAELPADSTLSQGKGGFTVTFGASNSTQTVAASDLAGNAKPAASASISVTAAWNWTWVSGANTINSPGVYGTQGVPAVNNVPGARDGSASWTDSAGDLWLFGGKVKAGLVRNDVWRYNPASDLWTYMGGTNTINASGVYGTPGVAAAGNFPGARQLSISWTDSAGNLWLFGGFGIDSVGNTGNLNDLWRYSPSSGLWTWISGSSTRDAYGIYGTQGMAAEGNVPGARGGSVSWLDSEGNLWLFGGYGHASIKNSSSGPLNDLWRYTPGTGLWTWVSGASEPVAQGVYGAQGVAAAGNVPSARIDSVSWMDSAGSLWLFGGLGWFDGGNGDYYGFFLDDLWRYSPGTGLWTWISGSSTRNAHGIYGTKGMAGEGNVPGARAASVSWIDSAGDLWLLGGYGYESSGNRGSLNDLWRFSPSSGLWTWVNGAQTTNAQGMYGTKGVAAAGNVPSSRNHAVSWTDSAGNLWILGGSTNNPEDGAFLGDLNDLWRYGPDGGP